jgi:hypothetical protein
MGMGVVDHEVKGAGWPAMGLSWSAGRFLAEVGGPGTEWLPGANHECARTAACPRGTGA